MIIEIALGIVLAFFLLATAALWMPLLLAAAALALVAAILIGVSIYPPAAVPLVVLAVVIWVFTR